MFISKTRKWCSATQRLMQAWVYSLELELEIDKN